MRLGSLVSLLFHPLHLILSPLLLRFHLSLQWACVSVALCSSTIWRLAVQFEDDLEVMIKWAESCLLCRRLCLISWMYCCRGQEFIMRLVFFGVGYWRSMSVPVDY